MGGGWGCGGGGFDLAKGLLWEGCLYQLFTVNQLFTGGFLPGIERAEEEYEQTHNALGVPPLHVLFDSRGRGRSGCGSLTDHIQQTGVTLAI